MENKIDLSKSFFPVMFMSIFVEAMITYFKSIVVYCDLTFSMLFSIIIGIILAISYDIDIPKIFGIESKYRYIGNIITGILISRGSNYIYDFISIFS